MAASRLQSLDPVSALSVTRVGMDQAEAVVLTSPSQIALQVLLPGRREIFPNRPPGVIPKPSGIRYFSRSCWKEAHGRSLFGGGGGGHLAALANQLSAPLVANKKLIAVDGPKKPPGVVQQLPVSSSSSASFSSEHSDWSGRTPNSLDGSFSTRNNLHVTFQ